MSDRITIHSDSRLQFVAEMLRKQLGDRRIVDDCDSTGNAIPLSLETGQDSQIGSQGFRLEWTPSIDPAEIFDPDFTWHGDPGSTSDQSSKFTPTSAQGRILGGGKEGLFYGALEFLERCDVRDSLPVRPIELWRTPSIPFRSSSLQLMKKGEYILPIRQELFPWFFDRAFCTRYLDFMAAQRFNAITFWNFHPFPYFCKIEGHPEVSEVAEEERNSNSAHLCWLIKEAAERGVRIFWHFYNIYVCPSFAKAHGLNVLYNRFTPAQEKQVFKYIRNCLRSFANEFPEVGFVACAGEGVPAGKAERFVADVLVSALNETAHRPPLIVRQWSSLSASRFSRDVVGKYDNLWCMIKHNAEHIAGTVPEARVADWVATGVPTVVNFHMLSEIGPFRWAPPAYIREMCLHYRALGVKGVHIFPHWQWRTPGVGDLNYKGDELDRDWLYHEAWGRYTFDPVRDRDEEVRHWNRRAMQHGLSKGASEALIACYEESGQALPRIQQHLWAHYDNHSILSAGLTLGQFRFARSMHGRKIIRTDRLEDILPLRAELMNWPSQTKGYRFDQAAEESEQDLVRAISILEPVFSAEYEEIRRLRADLKLMQFVVAYLRQKARIAQFIMNLDREDRMANLVDAVSRLRESLDIYKTYRDHAEKWYEGISDVPPYLPFHNYKSVVLPYTWTDCLELFERELSNLEEFSAAINESQLCSLVHHFGFDRADERRDLEMKMAGDGGRWLRGDPDFVPWAKYLSRMQKIVLLPCAVYPTLEISVLSDPAILSEWIVKGGHLVALTLPERPWLESDLLAQILGVDASALDVRTTDHGDERRLTIRAGDYLNWNERAGDRGIVGQAAIGKGRVDFFALASSAEWIRMADA